MNKIKLAFGALALSVPMSASAAMPDQIPDRWYDNMSFIQSVLSTKPGFCKTLPGWWC
jgi:hypothetical protein